VCRRSGASAGSLASPLCVLVVAATFLMVARPADAIIGGEPADSGYFGYMAHVSASLDPGTGFDCSASLISASVVLTAAHCVVDDSTNTILPADAFTVTTGSLDLSDSGPVPTRQARGDLADLGLWRLPWRHGPPRTRPAISR
jgi:secreted trypsin-like serine protease